MRIAWWIAIVLALVVLALPGCANERALREAQAEVQQRTSQLEERNQLVQRLRTELAEVTKVIQADPEKSELVALRSKAQQLEATRTTLQTEVETRKAAAAKIAELETEVATLKRRMAEDAALGAIKDNAVAYVKNVGFEVGSVKGYVSDDFDKYVVLKLDGFMDSGLEIVEESGLGGWSRFSYPNVFWYKKHFQSIEIITTSGSTDTVSKAALLDYRLRERILRAIKQ